MLSQLVKDIGELTREIEIIISNNCSTDNTQSVIEDWKSKVPSDLAVRVKNNSENIGVSRNIVSLFYMADTPFFMFLGDDDRLNSDFFPELMRILQIDNPPTAVIQGTWNGVLRAGKIGFVDWTESLSLFYEYGNAWAGVVKVQEAVRAIETRNLRSVIEGIVWPQTVMAFLAIYDAKPNQVFVSEVELGSRFSITYNICTKAYMCRSFYGLLFAAACIDKAIDENRFRKAFLRIKSFGFISNVKGILVHSLVEKGGDDTLRIRMLLREEYGLKGYLWAAVFWLSDHYNILYSCCKIICPIVLWRSPESLDMKLARFRIELANSISNKHTELRRHGDWF